MRHSLTITMRGVMLHACAPWQALLSQLPAIGHFGHLQLTGPELQPSHSVYRIYLEYYILCILHVGYVYALASVF